jgi:hypothetical protein
MQTKLLINGKLVAGGGEVEDYTVVRHVMAKP